MGDQPRQQQAGAVHQALDIGVDHGVPVVQVAVGCRVSAQSQAGIVDKAGELVELCRQTCNGLFHGLAITHVQHQAVYPGLLREFGTQGIQALFTAPGQHQRPARLGETAGTGFAKSRGGPGDE
ncbi:hypothetical protein D9M71_140600 [compost metagenome]